MLLCIITSCVFETCSKLINIVLTKVSLSFSLLFCVSIFLCLFLRISKTLCFSPARYTLPEPDVVSGIDSSKHLAILNINLRTKMCELLHNCESLLFPLLVAVICESNLYACDLFTATMCVTLDPRTACSKLVVSDDLSGVHYMEKKQEVPENPERLHAGVLGSRGFSSGVHCWDVEVGGNNHWIVGVVKQSVQRKKLLKLDPSSGIWSIRYTNEKYRVGIKSRKELSLSEKPQVIRIQLDYDNGIIVFSDRSKGSVLYTFTDEFTEMLLPYLNTACTLCPLRIS